MLYLSYFCVKNGRNVHPYRFNDKSKSEPFTRYEYLLRIIVILVRSTGIALLAARPAPPLSMASFAFRFCVTAFLSGKAFCSRKTAPTLTSCRVFGEKQKRKPRLGFPFLWCGRQGLNLHGVTHKFLSLARLPVPPRPH